MFRRVLRDLEESYEQNGLLHVLLRAPPYVYNRTLRPHLPKQTVEYNGIEVTADRITDGVNPTQNDGDRPNYESGLCRRLRKTISPGDTVVVVGGGWGVTATLAAQLAGEEGTVHVYEGAVELVPQIRDTVRRNGVDDRVVVHRAVVGSTNSVEGNEADEIVSPDELPGCDVLELDCEGAEVDILEGLDNRPEWIVVETHGHLRAPTRTVKSVVEELGYSVVDERIAEIDFDEAHREKDVMVLTCRLDASDSRRASTGGR